MFWTFRKASFFISMSYKNFRSSPSSGENTSPQILHLTQNTLSDHQNNGAIGSGIGKIVLWHNFCVAI